MRLTIISIIVVLVFSAVGFYVNKKYMQAKKKESKPSSQLLEPEEVVEEVEATTAG